GDETPRNEPQLAPDGDPAVRNEPGPRVGGDPGSEDEPSASGRIAHPSVPVLACALVLLLAAGLSAAFAGPIGTPCLPADGNSGRVAARVDRDRPGFLGRPLAIPVGSGIFGGCPKGDRPMRKCTAWGVLAAALLGIPRPAADAADVRGCQEPKSRRSVER